MITDQSLQIALQPMVSDLLKTPVGVAGSSTAALVVSDWWNHSLDVATIDPVSPDEFAAVICVDSLRTTAHPTGQLAADGHFYFVEAAADGQGQSFDVTGYLWRCGLSVIDVIRPRLDGDGGTWEFALGIARWTPTRSPTHAELAGLDAAK